MTKIMLGTALASAVALCASAATRDAMRTERFERRSALPYVERGDVLDPSFTALEALAAVERVCLCGEGDGAAVRTRVLRLICDYDIRMWDGRGSLSRVARELLKGIPLDGAGGEDSAHAVYARLKFLAGKLYDRPDLASAGETALARIRRRSPEALAFRTDLPEAVRAYDKTMALVREDLTHAVRPGGVDGRPFWNVYSKQFAYAPSFDFREDPAARRYRFSVLDDGHVRHDFEADSPKASLLPVWDEIPVGVTTVTCVGLDGAGRATRQVGERRFWRAANFNPIDGRPARRSFAEAVRLGVRGLLDGSDIAFLERTGHPDDASGSNFASYPSKMHPAVIRLMLGSLNALPAERARLVRIARLSADYLLSIREPAGSPLEGFPATYVGRGQRSAQFGGQIMLLYPARAGSAFLALYRETQDAKYRTAAERIANTYLRLQGADGTWPLKMNAADGTPVAENRLVPTSVIDFFECLYEFTGEAKYRAAADRAFACIDRGPLRDWMWEGQFEDVAPVEERYRNLTQQNAGETVVCLLKRFPNDARRRAQARELVRYLEDQFVVWRKPCRADGRGGWTTEYPFRVWQTPVAVEQYYCYNPIDASTANVICAYLALYAAEKNPIDLAKARALGTTLVNAQEKSGRIRTFLIPECADAGDPEAGTVSLPLGGDWFNCSAESFEALERLAAADLP